MCLTRLLNALGMHCIKVLGSYFYQVFSYYSTEQPMCRNVETDERPLNPVTMSALALNAAECHMVCKDTNNYPGAIGSEFFLQGGRETCECIISHDGLQVPQDPLPEEYSLYLCGDEEGNLIS